MAEAIILRAMKVYVNAEGDMYDEIPEGEEENYIEKTLEVDDVINIFMQTTPDITIIDTDYAIAETEEGLKEESAILYYEKNPFRVLPWNYLELV